MDQVSSGTCISLIFFLIFRFKIDYDVEKIFFLNNSYYSFCYAAGPELEKSHFSLCKWASSESSKSCSEEAKFEEDKLLQKKSISPKSLNQEGLSNSGTDA